MATVTDSRRLCAEPAGLIAFRCNQRAKLNRQLATRHLNARIVENIRCVGTRQQAVNSEEAKGLRNELQVLPLQ